MNIKNKIVNFIGRTVQRMGFKAWSDEDAFNTRDLMKAQIDPDAEKLAASLDSNIAIVRRVYSEIASLPFDLYTVSETEDGKEEYTKVSSDDPLQGIIKNPAFGLTTKSLLKTMLDNYILTGNGPVVVVRDDVGNIISLLPVPPNTLTLQVDVTTQIPVEYQWKKPGSTTIERIPLTDVINLKDINSENPYWGYSKLESIRTELITSFYIGVSNKNKFKNGTRFGHIFSPKAPLSAAQHDQLKKYLKAHYAGAENHNEDLWLTAPIDVTGSAENDTLAYEKDERFIREKILGVFGVPPLKAGVFEYGNYANTQSQLSTLWTDTLENIMCDIESTYNMWLFWMGITDKKYRFDRTTVQDKIEDQTARYQRYELEIQNGIRTANEIRAELNYTPLTPESNSTVDETSLDTGQLSTSLDKLRYKYFTTVRAVLSKQCARVLTTLDTKTSNGRITATFIFPEEVVKSIFDVKLEEKAVAGALTPYLQYVFKDVDDTKDMNTAVLLSSAHNADINKDTIKHLVRIIRNARDFDWKYPQVVDAIKTVFTPVRARIIVRSNFKSIADRYVYMQQASHDSKYFEE